jgi:RNA polymerase sigma factor (sigma-70 family)
MPQTQQQLVSTDHVDTDQQSSDVQSGPTKPDAAYADLVRGVEAGDETAISELYALLERGFRWYLMSHVGKEDAEDRLHDAFLDLVRAIQAGAVRDSNCLFAFARTIIRRKIATIINARVIDRQRVVTQDALGYEQVADQHGDPEKQAYDTEKVAVMRRALGELAPRDREILERFYVHEQAETQICREMGLTACQYRNLKSRAKTRLADLAERGLRRRRLPKAMSHVA